MQTWGCIATSLLQRQEFGNRECVPFKVSEVMQNSKWWGSRGGAAGGLKWVKLNVSRGCSWRSRMNQVGGFIWVQLVVSNESSQRFHEGPVGIFTWVKSEVS